MTVSRLPQFTPEAAEFWANIPAEIKPQLLANVFCSHCRDVVKIADFKGSVSHGDLVLDGSCVICGNGVTRVIDGI